MSETLARLNSGPFDFCQTACSTLLVDGWNKCTLETPHAARNGRCRPRKVQRTSHFWQIYSGSFMASSGDRRYLKECDIALCFCEQRHKGIRGGRRALSVPRHDGFRFDHLAFSRRIRATRSTFSRSGGCDAG
jgi:hypothetical protein